MKVTEVERKESTKHCCGNGCLWMDSAEHEEETEALQSCDGIKAFANECSHYLVTGIPAVTKQITDVRRFWKCIRNAAYQVDLILSSIDIIPLLCC